MNPVIAALLALPVLLGTVVILRMLWTAAKLAKAKLRPAVRGPTGPIVPILDEPFPCPTCNRLEHVHVARSNYKEMPYVEHFLCHACGTEYLGPKQEAMVAKRLEARRKVADVLAGRKPFKSTRLKD